MATQLVRDNKAQYDALWQGLCAKEDVRQSITHLQKVVGMIGLDDQKRKCTCRQYMRKEGKVLHIGHVLMTPHVVFQRHSSVLRFLGCIMLPNTPYTRHPVVSLDQLFAQAHIAHGLLNEKAKVWSLACKGMFAKKQTVEQRPRVVLRALCGGRTWTGARSVGRVYRSRPSSAREGPCRSS